MLSSLVEASDVMDVDVDSVVVVSSATAVGVSLTASDPAEVD